jgi:transposase
MKKSIRTVCEVTTGTLTVGLDLGDRNSYAVVLDEAGEVIVEGKLRTRDQDLRRHFGGLRPMRVAIEAGNQSMWVNRVLGELGHEVIVANPRRLRLISENPTKQDRVDAEYLARLARMDPKMLHPIRHRGEDRQRDVQLLRSRQALMQCRTALINHVRSAVKLFGERLPSCSADAFAARAVPKIPELLTGSLLPLLQEIARMTRQLKRYDRKVEELCAKKYPETRHLLQIRGVGPLTALAFVVTLEHPARFRTSRSVGPFVGLCPGRKQSGDRDPERRIHKKGDRYLRQLLVTCGHYILGPFGKDCDLRRHGEKIARQGGKKAKKRAVVAVARKLAVLMHHLWATEEMYDPLYNARKRAA